jgi:uncharacterized protein
MHFNVAQLLKEPIGSERGYQLDEYFTGPQRITEMACGPVHMLRTHQGILVRASLEIRCALTCSRCLGVFSRSSTLPIEEEFFPPVDTRSGRSAFQPDEPEGWRVVDSGNILDLTEVVREYAVTDLPMKPLCRPGCLGLCQVCGAEQNLNRCGCSASPADSCWGALAGLVTQHEG